MDTWDVFVCHASEDKDAVARPLALDLAQRGLTVWLDERVLLLGDELLKEIGRGIAACRFAVVILSSSFLAKEWPNRELRALLSREVAERGTIVLPVWHGLTEADVTRALPFLAQRLAIDSVRGTKAVADAVFAAVRGERALAQISPLPSAVVVVEDEPAERPPEVVDAVRILIRSSEDWRDGGYRSDLHGCFATSVRAALIAVRDRSSDLAAIDSSRPELGTMYFSQRRLAMRYLFGAVDRWHELSHLLTPSGLNR